MNRPARLAITCAAILTITSVTALALRLPKPALGSDQILLQTPKPIAAMDTLALRRADTHELVDRDFFSGRWSLLYTGYLNCPDVCPTTTAVLAQLAAEFSGEQSQELTIIFLSIDPYRDTPEKVAAYTAAFSNAIVPLTGNINQLTDLTDSLGLIDPPKKRVENVGHSSAVALIGPDADLRGIFRYPHSLDLLTTTLRTLL